MQKRLVIIGARGHGKVVADVALHMNRYKELLFLDDDEKLKETMGIPVCGKSGDIEKFVKDSEFVVAIGNAAVRKKIQESLVRKHAILACLIHPNAVIAEDVNIGGGTVIMAGAVINPDVKIGRGCIINTCASVDHDCRICDYVHVAVGAHISGAVGVGEGTWIGAGVTINNNIMICDSCMIGAGAVVVEDITEKGTYIGVPARKKKTSGNIII